MSGIDWEAQNKLAQAAEKKDCEKALLALAGWYPTPVEGYGFNTSWAISDLCRAIQKLREHIAVPLSSTYICGMCGADLSNYPVSASAHVCGEAAAQKGGS